jgi:RNA polymerase sigma-70 factor (ECF subfamily)
VTAGADDGAADGGLEDGPGDVEAAVAEAHRREWGFVLAATVRVAGSIDLAEECVQDAYGAALDTWRRQGVPRSPGAWLTTAARRRALDVLRREQTLRRKLPMLAEPELATGPEEAVAGFDEDDVLTDERLRLVFTCCHPALAREAQVALTLRLLCGLTTSEIAAAFLVSEATMAARVTRAKKKIAAARIPYRVPGAAELPERLDAVLTVLHLVFTTGHTAPSGADLVRGDLVQRAVELGRLLAGLMPDEPEVRGLLALMLLTDARRDTRLDADGRLVLLADQDRSRWDRTEAMEGLALVRDLHHSRVGRFGVQAAIAAEHALAPSYDETRWPRVLALYDALLREWPSPVVALNRAVVLAEVAGPEAALAEVDRLAADGRLAGYRYLPSTRADLLRRLGRAQEAAAAYREALALTDNEAERAFLAGRLAETRGR